MSRARPALLALLILLAGGLASGATWSDGHVAIAHAGGNEWWIEAKVSPTPQGVDARDTGGAWVALSFKSWGEWAASFRIEPGHDVQFRAHYANGTLVESCWFAHPGGESRCAAAPPPPPPPPAPAPPPAAGSLRLVAFGDTGSNATTRANANGSASDGATVWLGLGDYDYDNDLPTWEDAVAPLLAMEHHLAMGNHEARATFAKHMPNGTTWSVEVNGARVVAIDSTRDMRPGSAQHGIVRAALCDADEPLRIVAVHHSWWLGAGAAHPGSEFPASAADMDALVADCGVDVVLAAHEHNYQRTMRGDVAYMVIGTGGRSIYPVVGSAAGTVSSAAEFGRLLLDVNASGYAASFRALDGRTLDAWTGSPNATPPPAPAVAFQHGGGNEWWVEAKVAPQPARVEAMDEGGAWIALSWRSWGEWAGSFHVEPGHDVRFRATYANGTSALSCWFAHPAGTPECDAAPPPPPPPPPTTSDFDATFRNVRGNEWWVETEVRVTGGTLAGVDARVDGGAWVALEKKSWGSWAKSLRAPEGSQVEFRARATDGSSDLSAAYAWPPG